MVKSKNDAVGLEGSIWFQKAENRYLGGERIALLEKIDELGSINSAAKAVGISYKTAWHLVNMVNNLAEKPLVDRVTGGKGGGGTVLTREGKKVIEQFRIVQEEHRKYLQNLESRLGDASNLYQFLQRISMKISARNVFSGTIEKITKGAVNAEVTLLIGTETRIIAIITNGAVDNLGLKAGMNAYAIVKSSSIIIAQELHDAKLSARNILPGIISKLIEGPVSTEVDVEIGGGNVISAIITHGSSEKLALKEGDHACALFKASSVILGVN
ncbi:TOBE domain-containing protein [Chlorobium sp. KB01]|uniref:TOBE domain-containing protein n=1 Tax=Chlorobium sp. KB01 TaxID=1917528 RepID=UPI000978C25A|nr:TOBE domain-containing protein [Chlorobium sp. KB01]